MSIPSVYINLEDDVVKILTRLKHQSATQLVLVCPKRCFLFSEPNYLKILKKHTDALGKEIYILTMDEKGQAYAQAAGFKLKLLPQGLQSGGLSDIKQQRKVSAPTPGTEGVLAEEDDEIKNFTEHSVPQTLIPKPKAKIHKQHYADTKPEPKVVIKETFFPNFEPAHKRKNRRTSTNKIVTSVVAISLVLALVLAFVVLPKATVVVYAKTEPVTRDMEISMSPAIPALDVAKLAMPLNRVDESISVSDKFQDSGKNQVGNKASGSIKIYNFTKLPINLKAATTVLTLGNKTYNLVQDVSGVKPTTYKNPRTKEVDPDSLGDSVDIIAAGGGEDYNLPAGTRIEINNQVFGSKPLFLYAKTDTEVTGGTTRYLSVISPDDLTNAKNSLQDKALAQVRDKLSGQGLVLADGAYNIVTTQFSSDSPAGTQTPTFSGTAQVKISGAAFKKQDLEDLIFQRIQQTISSNKTLEQFQDKQAVYKIKNMDPNSLVAVLEVHYEGMAVYNLDLSNLTPQLVGKSQNQVEEILKSKPEIDKVEVTLAPAWQKNFPYFASKIKVLTGDLQQSPN